MKSPHQNCLTVLGSGTSTGIPLIGCLCHVCQSLDHRDKRLRTSVFLETNTGKNILVDTSPDLRTQMLNNNISALDAVIITHEHADHLHGLDDIRPFCFRAPHQNIPLYANYETNETIKIRFPYIFDTKRPVIGGGLPKIELNNVAPKQKIEIFNSEEFLFFNFPHGHIETMGFIHNNKMAYIVDCMNLPNDIVELLANSHLDLLILDCLQRKDHTTHLTVEKSFALIKKIQAKRTGLIHMGHDLSHSVLNSMALHEFPNNNVFPVYDGLKLYYP
jgi:phosphoribosyl 1,2-cyclic phosphate phosphodiesterase